MDLQVIDKKTKVSVSDDAFAKEFNEALVHQAVVAFMAGARAGTKGQKNRSAVSGGGIKPWRQKGTGRARAGTIRSPIWVGGGRTFAASNRDFSQKINKKMYRAAMRSIFSELARQERLAVMESLSIDAPKTKQLLAKLDEYALDKDVLIVLDKPDANVEMASRNLPYVAVIDVADINPVSLVGYEKVLVTTDALKLIEERLS